MPFLVFSVYVRVKSGYSEVSRLKEKGKISQKTVTACCIQDSCYFFLIQKIINIGRGVGQLESLCIIGKNSLSGVTKTLIQNSKMTPLLLNIYLVIICVADKAMLVCQCHLESIADIWLTSGVGHSSGLDE